MSVIGISEGVRFLHTRSLRDVPEEMEISHTPGTVLDVNGGEEGSMSDKHGNMNKDCAKTKRKLAIYLTYNSSAVEL